MTSHTFQGSSRLHEGIRRHAAWSHIFDDSRIQFSCHGLPNETWCSLDLVDARLRRQQVPEKVKTPDAVHPIDLVWCPTELHDVV